jgi:hypothetical protein
VTIFKNGCTWEANIKMDLKEMGWGGVDRINVARERDRWRAVCHSNDCFLP